ncbi:uncharacterized protein PAC_07649 [Phialocephala subalpina]|uniref:EthD domain-containing protein n=1 Tax=Phialocephala subalpina TaxID=576137 RepID=A0A1L7WYC1_9HELO|nr:uncharacterized protein PAC_07649 [Phialocephala subalpina]
MPGIATIFYPANARFNLDHYINKHMPMVLKKWSSVGLSRYIITEMDPAGGYSIQAILFWDDIESFRKALKTVSAEELMADVPNFSSEGPVIMFGTQVGSS